MFSVRRILVAMLIGLIGCVFIWVAAPYNNFFLSNSFISDTYFPVSAAIFLLVLVLAVNPLLHLMGAHWKLSRRQLALIFAMMLGAAVIPSQGLLRMLPWSIARSVQDINKSESLAEAFEGTGVRHELFPDPVGFGVATPTSDQFLDELEAGNAIPWSEWLPVLGVWGVFLLACWLLMVGVGLVLFPEWKEKERLPFPLLEVYRSLLPAESSQSVLPAVFRNQLFWLGVVGVMLLYASNGLNHHTQGKFPAIPMGWTLGNVFSESPWRYLSGHVKNYPHIYFVLVGMAFFMPNRIGFSIWFTTIAYHVYDMFGRAYVPAYKGGMVHDHRNGAMVAVTLVVLYLSRHHWRYVGSLMLGKAATDSDRLLKVAGWMVIAGALGMFTWLWWAGVPALWAAFFVLIGFMVSVLIARIVAETGMPFVRITGMNASYFMVMFPATWVTGAAIYMAGFISIIFQFGSRVSAAVMVSHAAGVDEKAGPKHQLRIGYMMIGILLLGLVVCGAVHLNMGYSSAVAMDANQSPLNSWGSQRMGGPQRELQRWTDNAWPNPEGRATHLVVGMGLAGALQWACVAIPRWPLHPIGLLLVGHFYGNTAWASVLLGWLIKSVLVYYGGAAAYKKFRPLFLGLILGEIFSAVIWTVVPVVLLSMGHDPSNVGHIPLLPK